MGYDGICAQKNGGFSKLGIPGSPSHPGFQYYLDGPCMGLANWLVTGDLLPPKSQL